MIRYMSCVLSEFVWKLPMTLCCFSISLRRDLTRFTCFNSVISFCDVSLWTLQHPELFNRNRIIAFFTICIVYIRPYF